MLNKLIYTAKLSSNIHFIASFTFPRSRTNCSETKQDKFLSMTIKSRNLLSFGSEQKKNAMEKYLFSWSFKHFSKNLSKSSAWPSH